MSIVLILAGLALAVTSAAIYARNIRSRSWLQVSCAGFGLVVAGICGLSDLMVGLPAAIAGLTAWGASAWASCRTFPVGQASVFQPAFFRDPSSPLNPGEWLVVMPGFRMLWDFFCRPVATLEIGRIAFEHEAEVRFPEGLAAVTFRVDAELPLDRPDLLGRFVQSVPSGTALTDARARTAYVQARLVALMKQVLEACSEHLSAYAADSLELQAIAEGGNPAGFNYLKNLAYQAQELLGLPAEGWGEDGNLVPRIRIDIIDIVLDKDLKDNLTRRSQSDIILRKAIEILEAEGKVSPAQHRLALRAGQRLDAARYDAMSDDEFNDPSLNPRVADANGEMRYRREAIEAENRNAAIGENNLSANPALVKLASLLESEQAAYVSSYGQSLRVAVDIAASGVDTFRISGLGDLGAQSSLEILRALPALKGGNP